MRLVVLLASTSLLAACGGGGAQTISSTPPAPTGGNGDPTNTVHTFADPKEAKSYVGIGGNHVYKYSTDSRLCCDQQQQIYGSNTTTIRDSSMSISYDPADAIFTLEVADGLTGANTNTRFQDPASRTDFGGNVEPQWGTARMEDTNYKYLQAGDGNPQSPYRVSGTGTISYGDNDTPPYGDPGSSYQATSLFYIEPGSETQYVTLAGYVRNSFEFREETIGTELAEVVEYSLERGAFVFGEVSPADNVPITGSGTYSGSMLASMIVNPTLDDADLPSFFQWIEGSADLQVDFATSTLALDLDGTVRAPQIDWFTNSQDSVIAEGATFTASGKGDVNLVNFGGFKGFFESAGFANPDGSTYTVNIEGSTIDGTFYGANGEEAGGGFGIVGGNPDERVDILGAFIGQK